MRLALAEMRHRRGRFAAILAAVVLLEFLALVLSSLADGLYYGATGALRTSSADIYVFSKDGLRQLTRSSLPAMDAATVARLRGVAAVGEVGVVQATGRHDKSTLDLALFGYVPRKPGGPPRATTGRLPKPGESFAAAADVSLRDEGVKLGDTITISGDARPLRIVGFTSDSRYELQPTLWTTIGTWRTVRNEVRPEFRGELRDVQALAVKLAPGASPTATANRIDAALGGSSEAVDRATAVQSLPGVTEQQSTLDQVIYATFVVAALVIALFFAVVILERRTELAILKAIGASNRYLLGGILLESLVVGLAAWAVASVLSGVMAIALPASIPFTLRPVTTATVAVATLVTAGLGAAFSFRRVTRIDPASALGGA